MLTMTVAENYYKITNSIIIPRLKNHIKASMGHEKNLTRYYMPRWIFLGPNASSIARYWVHQALQ